jgi:hypothetical protein
VKGKKEEKIGVGKIKRIKRKRKIFRDKEVSGLKTFLEFHLHHLGRTLVTWNPCGFHTTVSIVFGRLIMGRAFVGGFSSSGRHIYS